MVGKDTQRLHRAIDHAVEQQIRGETMSSVNPHLVRRSRTSTNRWMTFRN